MRNLIKKILKESDWEWDEVNNPLDGVKVKSPMGGVFTIVDNGGDYVDITWNNGESSTRYYRKSVESMIKGGVWTLMNT